MMETILTVALVSFWVWVTVKAVRFTWRATDPRVISEMRTQAAMARIEREREAQRRLGGR